MRVLQYLRIFRGVCTLASNDQESISSNFVRNLIFMQIHQDSWKQVCGIATRTTSNVEWLEPEPKLLNGGTGAGV